VIEESVVEVLSAQEGVSVGRLDLEDSFLDLQDTDIEGAAAKIVNSNPVTDKPLMNRLTKALKFKRKLQLAEEV
jgi:hypothetical protein